jgi:hypothetical protein
MLRDRQSAPLATRCCRAQRLKAVTPPLVMSSGWPKPRSASAVERRRGGLRSLVRRRTAGPIFPRGQEAEALAHVVKLRENLEKANSEYPRCRYGFASTRWCAAIGEFSRESVRLVEADLLQWKHEYIFH